MVYERFVQLLKEGHGAALEQARALFREVLREELDKDLMIKVLTPEEVDAASLSTGVLCEHPDGGPIYMLFRVSGGPYSGIAVSEIDEEFKVTNVRRIIRDDEPSPATRHNVVNVIYDPVNDHWMVFTATYDKDLGWCLALTRFNREFVRVMAPTWLMLDGVRWTTGDGGGCPVYVHSPAQLYKMYVIWNKSTWIEAAWTDDFTAMVPTFSNQGLIAFYRTWHKVSTPHSFKHDNLLLALVETTVDLYGTWNVMPMFGFGYPEEYATIPERGLIFGLADRTLMSPPAGYDTLHTGIPHLTWLPTRKFPVLFHHLVKRDHIAVKSEIWATRINREMLSPAAYSKLFYQPWYKTEITTAGLSTPRLITRWGKRMIFKFLSRDDSGTLSIWSAPHLYDPSRWYRVADYSVSKGVSMRDIIDGLDDGMFFRFVPSTTTSRCDLYVDICNMG